MKFFYQYGSIGFDLVIRFSDPRFVSFLFNKKFKSFESRILSYIINRVNKVRTITVINNY